MKKLTITMTTCNSDHNTISYSPSPETVRAYLESSLYDVRQSTQEEPYIVWRLLADLFAEKRFGKHCFFFRDSGLPIGYGQIFEALPDRLGGGNTSKTGRVYLQVLREGEVLPISTQFNNFKAFMQDFLSL